MALKSKHSTLDLPPSTPFDLVKIPQKYASVFSVPSGIPPPHCQDHSIPLQDGVTIIKGWPYRYPFSYKAEIERLVDELLTQGLIQPSKSHFSAPVLLVNEKDGT